MKSYLELLEKVLTRGKPRGDRTGTGTIALFGEQLRFNLQEGFPLLTTKKVHWKSVAHELIWFLNGETNIKYLKENGVSIWDEWADKDGNLGPVYGKQWRAWRDVTMDLDMKSEHEKYDYTHRHIDQIAELIEGLKKNPEGRRHLVSAWNPAEVSKMKLPPCHYCFQMFVEDMSPDELDAIDEANGGHASPYPAYPTKKLSCMFNMRSADMFLGVPFNIASYALLTHLVARVCGYGVGELILNMGDCHIYSNHVEQVKTQLSRTPGPLPKLSLGIVIPGDLRGVKFESLILDGYNPQSGIKAPVAV